ncbi:MAG TPA: hypothetical protein VJV78_42320 [Polyangiales bacterium]|nr:hypothetical protein [Polyangiales bacterium]
MLRIVTLMSLAVLAVSAVPCPAAAGGAEFPAGGARGIGRGSSNFARADDPMVMARNPALLSDLWTNMAFGGANVLLVDSCYQATGSYGNPWGYRQSGDDIANFGAGTVFVNPPEGATTVDGMPLPRVQDEALPEVCYTGPVPIVPRLGLTLKLAPNLGIGLAFLPPDLAGLNQWGNRDGTVMTDNGLRSSPTRFFRAHQNTSYFSAMGSVGYRLADWLAIGGSFQWALVAYNAWSFSRISQNLTNSNDVRSKVFGRDLFIPGLIASVQITPIDALDIAIGFKWSDRVRSVAKVDAETGAFGAGMAFPWKDAQGNMRVSESNLLTVTNNLRGNVDAPPIWVPQLSFGLRYADRLVPRAGLSKWSTTHTAAGNTVQDSMATERWDIEADAIMYFNSVTDSRKFQNPGRFATLTGVPAMGDPIETNVLVGACVQFEDNDPMKKCLKSESPAFLHGKDHFSFRVGGDYNVFPGMFSVRAGFSYETDGTEARYTDITNYMLGRMGIHVGATLRIAKKTDISIGYVHFIQNDVRLTPNLAGAPLPKTIMDNPDKYHLVQGDNDGEAGFAISDSSDPAEGPLFANAGTYYYHLDVIAFDFAQHF